MKLLTYISKNTREVNQMKHRMQTEIYHHGFCFSKLSWARRGLLVIGSVKEWQQGVGGKAPKRHMNISIRSLFAVWNL